MREDFLQFIWQFQYFLKDDLHTTEGKKLIVFSCGELNTDSGADFNFVKISIEGIEWYGHVELHLKSSDWDLHRHQYNEIYNAVVLHVVWEHDREILREDGSPIPTLELRNIVDHKLLYQYQFFLESKFSIACAPQFNQISLLSRIQMLDKALARRLESKADSVRALWNKNQQDWEETTYQLLLKNFGFKINSEVFQDLSTSLPYKILLKNADKQLKIEALLFGQSGFLDQLEAEDDYTKELKREYQFLALKYGLQSLDYAQRRWKMGRLRPANSPFIRLAQLASLIGNIHNLFSFFLEGTTTQIKSSLKVKPSDYWQEHDRFHRKSDKKASTLGDSSIENILINTATPLFVAYSKEKGREVYMHKALSTLESLSAENNKITKEWAKIGFKVSTAFDSQALIGQYNDCCREKQCLKCVIGVELLKKKNKQA